MSDRELLELAAKAAGLEPAISWNPLTDDGDALRLAVGLRFVVDVGVMLTGIDGPLDGQDNMTAEQHGSDPYAATRRAIVRAAAEIGRTVK